MGSAHLDWNEIHIDLKAAARLGAPEALDLALAALDDWPAFVANARLKEEDVKTVLVPLGELLAAPAVPEAYLYDLTRHPLAGARALAAAAFALRALRGEEAALPMARDLAADPRAEVRLAMVTALTRRGAEAPEALAALLRRWLTAARRPRLAATALQAVQSLARLRPEEALTLLAETPPALRTAPEVQRALGDALRQIAAQGLGADVLALLEGWQADGLPEEAVLRALRGDWAHTHHARAAALLDALEARTGPSRALRRTRQRLQAPEDQREP